MDDVTTFISELFKVILIGLFFYYIAVKMFDSIKEFYSPKDDRIEVAKL